jgi:hypothetical protein
VVKFRTNGDWRCFQPVQKEFEMKKCQWFAMGILAVLLFSALASCGSTGPSKAEQKQERIRQQQEQEVVAQRAAAIAAAAQKAELERAAARKAAEEKAAAERKAAEERAAAAQRAAEERQAAIEAANARGVTAEDFDYDVTRDGTGIVITRYKGMATIVNIPAVIEGLPVKELGTYQIDWRRAERYFGDVGGATVGAFFDTNITSVTIPDSVISIADGETYGYEHRYEYAYEYAYQTSYLSAGSGVFTNCRSLKSVTLPRNLKVIPNGLFAGCTSLEAITLPDGLQSIGNRAFVGCTSLETIAFPDSLTTINGMAYEGCLSLTAVILPKNLKTLGGFDFKFCTSLESVTFQSNNLEITEGSFAGCTALSTLNINANIRINGSSSFEDCPITTVNIGPAVNGIRNVDQIPQDNLSIASKAALRRLGY